MVQFLGVSVWRPGLLVAVSLVMVGAMAVDGAMAEPGSEVVGTPLDIGSDREPPTRTEATGTDTLAAERLLVESLLGQDASAAEFDDARVWSRDGRREFHATIVLPKPIPSDGPWYSLICEDEFTTEFSFEVRDATTFALVVNQNDARILGWLPVDYPWDLKQIGTVRLLSVETGKLIDEYESGEAYLANQPECAQGR